MEEDYFELPATEVKELEALGITYRWRDSCLSHLKTARLCAREHPYLEAYYCRELSEQWLQCQQQRERKLCSQANLTPAMKAPKLG